MGMNTLDKKDLLCKVTQTSKGDIIFLQYVLIFPQSPFHLSFENCTPILCNVSRTPIAQGLTQAHSVSSQPCFQFSWP